MSVTISEVERGSPCDKKGIRPGDVLLEMNGRSVDDVLDYRFYIGAEKLKLLIRNARGGTRTVRIRKGEDEDIGLGFETYLMDRQRSCRNRCIFCFIDQLPPGMRESLYFKDDDSRLSFLFGNYITLTNLTRRDIERIKEMHISPVNVSVHTMKPALRVEMMGNPRAGESLGYLGELAGAGIQLNCQLVLCPGINDGAELVYSLGKLRELLPALRSVAAVPVGLTKHREGLYPLHGFTSDEAARVIDDIGRFNSELAGEGLPAAAYAADEFFLKAGREIPGAEYYGEYPQLENGVGMWRLLLDEFCDALKNDYTDCIKPRNISIATGSAAYPLICKTVDELKKICNNISIRVFEVPNVFFGAEVTVAGLLTGSDYLAALSGGELGEELLIPSSSLRREGDLFLDGLSVRELSERLGVKVTPAANSGGELLRAYMGLL